MGYCLNRNFLLLLTVKAIINTGVQGTLIEPKVPRLVSAYLGSDTTINCTVYTDISVLKVKWYFCKTSDFEDQKMIKFHSSNCSSVSHYHQVKVLTASYLTIRNVSFIDVGWYFCEITQDIPQLYTQRSNGSKLVIYSPIGSNLGNNTTISATISASENLNSSPWWLWVASAAGCALIITTVIITTIICRRKKSNFEPPIYENTKEESKRHWKEAQSLHHCVTSSDYSNIQTNTLKPHKYESSPNGRRPSPKHK